MHLSLKVFQKMVYLIRYFPNDFTDGIEAIKSSFVSINLTRDAKLIFLKSGIVPFTLIKTADLELEV